MNLPRKQTVAWTVSISISLAAFVAGLTCLVLTRYGPLDARPWAYVGLTLAGLSAVAGMLLAIAEADLASDTGSSPQD